jgi:hypothetical protein
MRACAFSCGVFRCAAKENYVPFWILWLGALFDRVACASVLVCVCACMHARVFTWMYLSLSWCVVWIMLHLFGFRVDALRIAAGRRWPRALLQERPQVLPTQLHVVCCTPALYVMVLSSGYCNVAAHKDAQRRTHRDVHIQRHTRIRAYLHTCLPAHAFMRTRTEAYMHTLERTHTHTQKQKNKWPHTRRSRRAAAPRLWWQPRAGCRRGNAFGSRRRAANRQCGCRRGSQTWQRAVSVLGGWCFSARERQRTLQGSSAPYLSEGEKPACVRDFVLIAGRPLHRLSWAWELELEGQEPVSWEPQACFPVATRSWWSRRGTSGSAGTASTSAATAAEQCERAWTVRVA